MPPKKKKGGKKKKKKDDVQLELEDKYKKTLDGIEALKDHLGVRKSLTRRANLTTEDMHLKMTDTEKELETHREDQKAINADMTRQYKTMQTDMGLIIHTLETELERTKHQLRKSEKELKKVKTEKESMAQEKDNFILSLELKMAGMEKAYENIIRQALESLANKIDKSKHLWDNKSALIQAKNKQILLEFGLNPLDI